MTFVDVSFISVTCHSKMCISRKIVTFSFVPCLIWYLINWNIFGSFLFIAKGCKVILTRSVLVFHVWVHGHMYFINCGSCVEEGKLDTEWWDDMIIWNFTLIEYWIEYLRKIKYEYYAYALPSFLFTFWLNENNSYSCQTSPHISYVCGIQCIVCRTLQCSCLQTIMMDPVNRGFPMPQTQA